MAMRILAVATSSGIGIARASSAPSPSPAPKPTPAGAKNILFMIADDLRPELSVYGQPIHSPNLAALAERGLRFDRAFTQMAVCAPSRNSIFSGRRPDTSGVWNFIDWFRNETQGADAWLSMPEYFKSFNYTSLGFGKSFHGCTNEGNLLAEGYCDLERSWSTEMKYLPYVREHCPNKASFCHIEDETKIFDYQLAEAAVSALKWSAGLRPEDRKPFFMAVGFKKTHSPWGSPSRFFDLYDLDDVSVPAFPTAPIGMPQVAFIQQYTCRLENGTKFDWGPEKPVPVAATKELRRAYFASVSFLDEQVGKILQALDDTGLAGETVVLFTSDHGYHLGEHGEWEKKTNFELTNRVPLIIAAPHKARSHGRATQVVTDLVDLYPTLVDLAGLPSATELTGESSSLASLFEDPTTPPSGRDGFSYSQYPRCAKIGADDGCNSVKKTEFKFMGYSIRSDNYRYTAWLPWNTQTLVAEWDSDFEDELYNHTGDKGDDFDSFENINLAVNATAEAAVIKGELFQAIRTRFGPKYELSSLLV